MKIIDELIASIPDDIPVRSALIGAHWTVVCSRHEIKFIANYFGIPEMST